MKATIFSIIAVLIAGFLIWQIAALNNVAPTTVLAGGPVIVTPEVPKEGDAFEVIRANIIRKNLQVEVSYSGGCEEHGFKTYANMREFDPLAVGQQAQPLINLFLVHDDPGDPCDSIVNQNIEFDLTPILNEYKNRYGEKQVIGLMLQPYGSPFTNHGLQYNLSTSEIVPVELVEMLPDLGARYSIRDARLNGTHLIVQFSSGGGCEEHVYTAYSTALKGFNESNPVQVGIHFTHDDNGDTCEAVVEVTYTFDLAPIIALYEKEYGNKDSIVFTVSPFDTVDRHIALTYTP